MSTTTVFAGELATPAILLELTVIDANVRRLADYAARHRMSIRPHTKTHKSLRLAAMQIEAGAKGLTAAKVGEAAIMSAATDDILIAYPPLDTPRAARVAGLATSSQIRVAADTVACVDALAAAASAAQSRVGVLVDLDVGFGRTGVQSAEAALSLAQHIDRKASLRLDGLFFYPGHVWAKPDDQAGPLGEVASRVAETIELWRRSGLAASIVSGGSTPTAYQSHLIPHQTEIRPGTYIFNDMNTVAGGFCQLADCAATIACTVISDAVKGKVVIDGGTKTFTSDRNVTQPDAGFGYIIEFPAARIVRLSEEHGEVDVSACEQRPALGQRLHVIPNHICPCVNLQDQMYLLSPDGSVEALSVDARGKLS